MTSVNQSKGASLEKQLRAFFLRSGFFVIRGVPFRFGDEDLTDVDLWLYEHSNGTSRRVLICDVKHKQKPKAVERIFWTSGLAKALGVDGAYVATTDKRSSLRPIARTLDINLIDGADIQRIQSNPSLMFDSRISDENLLEDIARVDAQQRNKNLQSARADVLSALSDGFGAASAVRSLSVFGRLAEAVVSLHPDSLSARSAGRLAYLSASIVCQSIDYVSTSMGLRSFDERRSLIVEAVRLGGLGSSDARRAIEVAFALVEKFHPEGKKTARMVEATMKSHFEAIPAEIIAEQAMRSLKTDQLFSIGCQLEMAAYSIPLPNFDQLEIGSKSMLGALLDFAGIDRERFARAWNAPAVATSLTHRTEAENSSSE